ncbi:MAG: hypothetical protein ACM3ST_15040 [Bdellovibrio bacteriovorus]
MKTFLAVALVILSSAAMAKGGGDQNQKGLPGDDPGTVEETGRALQVKCPSGTVAAGVEAVPDEEGVVMIVECNYPE